MSDANRYKVRLIDGLLIDPWSPSGPVPSPETVAYGLAHLCRYGGHVKRPYSVGEHTIWVALYLAYGEDSKTFLAAAEAFVHNHNDIGWYLMRLTREQRDTALLGLIHDAPEGCGLVDVPGPVLRHEEMTPYKAAHVRCMDWLCEGWGIEQTVENHNLVKKVDYSILGAEMAIRPFSSAGDGGGENLPSWTGFHLDDKHDLNRRGAGYIRDTWSLMFNLLRRISP